MVYQLLGMFSRELDHIKIIKLCFDEYINEYLHF
jgi:hypothetical protein